MPTLAGLLAAGTFPQQFFPRLMVTVTIYPNRDKSEFREADLRRVDSTEIAGSIPAMLEETMVLIQSRIKARTAIQGEEQKESPDYPPEALREALVNALQHRDYSPAGRGTHVRVELFADRLEIISPGGLYGPTTAESLGSVGISATRNEYLSRLLAYMPLGSDYTAVNHGTGFRVMTEALSQARMPAPEVHNSVSFFHLTLNGRRNNALEIPSSWNDCEKALLSALRQHASLSVKEIVAVSGASRATISKHARRLVESGMIEPMENSNSPKQRYRLSR